MAPKTNYKLRFDGFHQKLYGVKTLCLKFNMARWQVKQILSLYNKY
jgi:hypothetical protein